MDISGLNRPVEFYNKNTGNNINYINETERNSRMSNIFSPGPMFDMSKTNEKKERKKIRRNKRLNTVDSDYIPDEVSEDSKKSEDENFFIGKKERFSYEKIKEITCEILIKIPLANYFLLRKKEKNIKNTVRSLNDINRDMDDLMNMTVPSGEEEIFYANIAQNLTNAASIIGKSNKKYGKN